MDVYEPFYYDFAARADGWNAFPRANVIHYVSRKAAKPIRILDIGCGTAEILSYLPRDISYVGIERSAYAVEKARERWKNDPRRVTFAAAECPPIPYPDASCDGVLVLFSLEHVRDPKGLLKECVRVLKPGGFLVLSAPNLELPFSWPSALRHKSFLYRVWFHSIRIGDYLGRLFGFFAFRVLDENFTDRTGRYERKDDDLRVCVSSWEVIRFLEARGCILEEFWSERELRGVRRILTRLPTLRWYGMTLAAAFRRV